MIEGKSRYLAIPAAALAIYFIVIVSSGSSPYHGPIIENFAELDHQGGFFELYKQRPYRYVALINFCLECGDPSQKLTVVERLHKKYSGQIKFYLVSNSHKDSRRAIVDHFVHRHYEIPVLIDQSWLATQSIGFRHPDDAALIETAGWRRIFLGSYEELDRVINDVQLGRELETPMDNSSPWKLSDTSPTPTYRGDIYPIFKRKCVSCHDGSNPARVNLDRYEDAKQAALEIRDVIRLREMPVWDADPYYGPYRSDISLHPQEIRTILTWIDSGRQKGETDAKYDAPEATSFHADITYGPFDEPVAAHWTKPWKHRFLGKVEEEILVSKVRVQLNNGRIVRHLTLVATSEPLPENFSASEVQASEAKHLVLSVIPLQRPSLSVFPEGTAMRIPKDSYLYLGEYFTPTAKNETATVKIEVEKFAGKRRPHILQTMSMKTKDFEIPAGQSDYPVMLEIMLEKDIAVTNIGVLMFLRGKSFRLSSISKSGKSATFFSIPRFNFYNRRGYSPEEPVHLKAGTRILAEAVFDNSITNPNGVDTTQVVLPGPDPKRNEAFTVNFVYYSTD